MTDSNNPKCEECGAKLRGEEYGTRYYTLDFEGNETDVSTDFSGGEVYCSVDREHDIDKES